MEYTAEIWALNKQFKNDTRVVDSNLVSSKLAGLLPRKYAITVSY